MDPFKPPFPRNRERYFAVPLKHQVVHPPPSPLLHPLHQPRISSPSSPPRPSRHPYNSAFHHVDPRRPLPPPNPGRPNDQAADLLAHLPISDGRSYLANDMVASPVFFRDEVPRSVRRRSPPPIGWEKHAPRSPDGLRHHQGRPAPLLEAAGPAHVIRKRFDPQTGRFEFVHEGRVDESGDRRDHQQHEENRRVRRCIDPRFEPFILNSVPSSSSAAVDPDHRRPVEWAARSKSQFDSIENLERSAAVKPEKIIYNFDGPVSPDYSRDRYLIAGLKPPDHSPVKKTMRTRRTVEAPRPLESNSAVRAARIGHFLDDFNISKSPDYTPLDMDNRIRYPLDGPKSPDHSSIKRDSRLRHSFGVWKPLDHISVEGAKWDRDPFEAMRPLQQLVEREPVDDDDVWFHQPHSWEKAKETLRHDDNSTRVVHGTRLPLHARLGDGKKMAGHEKLQKPSAFLRIQPASKPNRKRKEELLLSSANIDSLSNADLKGKAIESLPQHLREKDAYSELDVHARHNEGKKMVRHEKLQKPSALLRIQPAGKLIRKRIDEPLVSSAIVDGLSSIDLKGEAVDPSTPYVSEKDSPLELDVSFKSNSLVAKPISIPPAKPNAKSSKMVLERKKKKKVIKRFVSSPVEEATEKSSPALLSDSLPNEIQYSEVKEDSRPSPRMDGNGTVDVLSSSPCQDLKQTEVGEVKVSNASSSNYAALVSCPPEVVLLDDSSVEGSPQVATVTEDQKGHKFHEEDEMKIFCPERDFTSYGKDVVVLDSQSPSTSLSGGGLQDVIPAEALSDGHGNYLEAGVVECEQEKKDKMEASTVEECGMMSSGNFKDAEEVISQEDEGGIFSLGVQASDFDRRSPTVAPVGDATNQMVEGPHQYVSMQSEEQVLPVTTDTANDDDILHSPDQLSTISSPESLPVVSEAAIPNTDQSLCQPLDETHPMDPENKFVERSDGEDNHVLKSQKSDVSACEVGVQLVDVNDHMIHVTEPALVFQETKRPKADTKSPANELPSKTTHHVSGIPRSFRHSAAFVSGSVKNTSANSMKPRTWRRTGFSSSSPSPARESSLSNVSFQQQSSKRAGNLQAMAYIRKGNSLVRNFAAGTALSWASQGLSTNISLVHMTNGDKTLGHADIERKPKNNTSSKTAVNPYAERPHTHPLPHATMAHNCSVKLPNISSNSTAVENQAVSENFLCGTSDPVKPTVVEDAPWSVKASEKQSVDVFTEQLKTHGALDVGKSKSPKTKSKKMIYVKRKSNQLVAAPRPEIQELAVPSRSRTQALSCSRMSDFYYKRKKNQLVLNNVSVETQTKPATAAVPDDISNLEGQRATKLSYFKYSEVLNKRRFHKAIEGTRKTSKLALVWSLGGMQSHSKDTTSLQQSYVLPYLVPWKRPTYWRSIKHDSAVPKSPFSLMRKLKLSRKRDALYTRSKNGFSLRKSRVLSIGGSNLKWSKSIEARSKKANEAATLAVAAVEREKREQMVAGRFSINSIDRSCTYRKSSQGERIFRIGCFRYKMDVSKRTLLRIPDEKSSCSMDANSGKESKISFIPRRLLIGNDEYVRIGNGNQLVRDPKRLTRLLASEKIRWSLHNARLRLARKKQFCQFFMRFGKCRKDDGKCPYIHDPDKVAVCTKFLKGLCADAKCKLTHKVIPERMQDCSYFLQGLCTNESCPYRHVNVNPCASVCDGFLRGYCANGNECRKKHSYVCPLFKANGMCPQGSACKLHHPKIGNKCKKRKRAKKQKNGSGRYFGSPVPTSICLSEKVASGEYGMEQDGDVFFFDGRYADYISLDASDVESKETNTPTGTTMSCGGDSSDLHPDNLDMLMKPVRIMNENV